MSNKFIMKTNEKEAKKTMLIFIAYCDARQRSNLRASSNDDVLSTEARGGSIETSNLHLVWTGKSSCALCVCDLTRK